MKLNESIFREYDIRGIAGKDLNSDIFESIGKAAGTHLKTTSIVVARDNRLSSSEYRDALVKGLVSTGKKVIDVGVAPAPVLYYALRHFKVPSGMVITASHNPGEYNGAKILRDYHCIFGKEIKKIFEIIELGKFTKGKGDVAEKDAVKAYCNMIKEKVKLKRKLKVVVDAGNGTAGAIAPQLLRELGCDVTELYCDSDGSYPNHLPDPTQPQYYKKMAHMLKSGKFDLGIAYDGDADRLGVIDNQGEMIYGDQMMILFSREVLEKHPGAKICVEVKCSQGLVEDIEAHGGVPIMCATGHSLIEAKMIEEDALLTGEMSGHMFFRDEYFGFDDAIYASCRLLRILSNTDQNIHEILATAPKYYSTPEIRAECPDNEKFGVVKEIVKYFKQKYKVIDVDGARVLFEGGWGLVRASNTQPVIVVRCEAKTKPGLEKIKKIIGDKLREYPSVKINL